MVIYVNGNKTIKEFAFAHFVRKNYTADIEELLAIFEKGLQTDGEDQRDLMLDDGIEIILD